MEPLSHPTPQQKCSLSQLNDDCLRDVFIRLDHGDLDEISVLNGRMNVLAKVVRPRARKIQATELRLKDETGWKVDFPRVVTVNVLARENSMEKVFDSNIIKSHGDCHICEDFARTDDWIERSGSDVCNTAPALHQAFLFTEWALKRFWFKKVYAETNKYFGVMSALFDRFLPLDHPDELEIIEYFANDSDVKPFWNWIIAGKPKTVTICNHYGSCMLNLESLDKYSTAVHSPSINFLGKCGQVNSAPNEERAPEIFGRFANMHLAIVDIEPRCLLKIVMERALNRLKGMWKMNTSHYITLSAINAAIDPTWEAPYYRNLYYQGEPLKRGDAEMDNSTRHRYAIRDSTGLSILFIDTAYKLVNQAGARQIYSEQVTIHFC